MDNAINLLNTEGYFHEGTEQSVDGRFDVARYVLRNKEQHILHEIVIHNEMKTEEVAEKIDTAKRQRNNLSKEQN